MMKQLLMSTIVILCTWVSTPLYSAGIELEATQRKTTLLDEAKANPDLTIFVAAMQAAQLLPTLQGPGPYTILAPSNSAFARLPEGTVDNLMKPENQAKLRELLLHHIIRGEILSVDIKPGKATPLQGRTIDFKMIAGSWHVNNAKIVTTDLKASNGVIHIIDAVLIQ